MWCYHPLPSSSLSSSSSLSIYIHLLRSLPVPDNSGLLWLCNHVRPLLRLAWSGAHSSWFIVVSSNVKPIINFIISQSYQPTASSRSGQNPLVLAVVLLSLLLFFFWHYLSISFCLCYRYLKARLVTGSLSTFIVIFIIIRNHSSPLLCLAWMF